MTADNMTITNIEILDPAEAALAKVLVRNKLVLPEVINDFIKLKKTILVSEKPLLGEILIGMGLIVKSDLDAFVELHKKEHLDFLESLYRKGFLTMEQHALLLKKYNESGQSIATLVSEQNIMTKENYNKLFNNSALSLKLGEWLVVSNKVSNADLDKALAFRNVATLESYLVNRHNIKRETLGKIRTKIGVD